MGRGIFIWISKDWAAPRRRVGCVTHNSFKSISFSGTHLGTFLRNGQKRVGEQVNLLCFPWSRRSGSAPSCLPGEARVARVAEQSSCSLAPRTMDPPSPFEAKKSLNRQHSPTSWLGTNLYEDSPLCSAIVASSLASSRLPITSTTTAALMTQQAVIDLVNSQQDHSSHHDAMVAATASGTVLDSATAAVPTTPPRRSSALLRSGWAGLRRGLPLASLLTDDHHSTSASLSLSRSSSGIVDEERVLAVLALTTREVRSIALADDDEVDGRPSSPFGSNDNGSGAAFRRLQQHIRDQGFVTDTAIKHRLPELLRSHRLERVEAERRRQQEQSNGGRLPEMAAYELEFASSSVATPPPPSAFRADTRGDRCHDDGGASGEDEKARTARRTGTSSPRSIVQVVDFPDDDGDDAAFLDSPTTACAKVVNGNRSERPAMSSSPVCSVMRFQP